MRGDFLAIVKTDIPMCSQLCQQTIRELVKAYPFIESKVLTTTAFGRPVLAQEFGSGER